MTKGIHLGSLLIFALLAIPFNTPPSITSTPWQATISDPQLDRFSSSAPNFTLTVYPLARTVYIGGKTTYAVGLTSINGFTGVVALKIENLTAALLLLTGFDPKSVTLSSNGSANSTLTVDAINAGEENFTDFQIVATSGNLSSRVDVQLTILVGGMQPTPISYAFLGGVLLFSAFIVWYGLRARRRSPPREDITEGPKPPPV